jgi:hypothetical protein
MLQLVKMTTRQEHHVPQVDVLDVYHSIVNQRNEKEQRYDTMANAIVKDININIKTNKVIVQSGNQINTDVVWKWNYKSARGSESLDMDLLKNKLKERLHLYEVSISIYPLENETAKLPMFPVRNSIYMWGNQVKRILLKILAFPIDLLAIPVILTYNGSRNLFFAFGGKRYKTMVSLVIPHALLSDMQQLQPGNEGYHEARRDFESIVATQ